MHVKNERHPQKSVVILSAVSLHWHCAKHI